MSTTYYYDLPTVSCGHCTSTIEKALAQAIFLKECSIGTDPIDKKLAITFEQESLSYLEVMGLLNAIIEPVGHTCAPCDETKRGLLRPWWRSHGFLGGLGTTLGFGFLTFCFFMTSPFSFGAQLLIAGLSTALTLGLGAEFYISAFSKLKKGNLTMDTLFSISTSVSLLASIGSLFFPALPTMFEAGLLIFGFRHIGLAVHDVFKKNLLIQQRLQDTVPSTVLKKIKEKTDYVLLNTIKKGDLIELHEGDLLPVDGFFDEIDGLVVDDIVTGNNNPRRIIKGERLYAGTRLLQASKPLLFNVIADASSSHLAVLDEKITRSKFEKSPLKKEVDKILSYFIPLVLVAALLSFVIVGFTVGLACGLMCAISVLASACPCTLGLITPFSLLIGMRKAAKGGIAFNSATKLEVAHQVNCIAFDLNGTLTMGKPQVVRYQSLDKYLTDEAMLGLCAHFEHSSPHPIAKAIRDKAKNTSLLTGHTAFHTHHHAGLVVDYEGAQYALGGASLMIQQGVLLPSPAIKTNPDESLVYLARNRELIGYVILEDKLRPEARKVVEACFERGMGVHLITGESQASAERRAKTLGIPLANVRANCLSHKNAPLSQSKKQYILELKKQGKCVAMVGDAGNDAEAIAASDVGFALNMGSHNLHTQQQAAAVIQSQSLMPLVHGFRVAEETIKNIKQNLFFSLIYNTLAIFISGGCLLGWGIVLNPAVGAALMIVQMIFVLMNVCRFGLTNNSVSFDFLPAVLSNSYISSLSSLFKISKTNTVEMGQTKDVKINGKLIEPDITALTYEKGIPSLWL